MKLKLKLVLLCIIVVCTVNGTGFQAAKKLKSVFKLVHEFKYKFPTNKIKKLTYNGKDYTATFVDLGLTVFLVNGKSVEAVLKNFMNNTQKVAVHSKTGKYAFRYLTSKRKQIVRIGKKKYGPFNSIPYLTSPPVFSHQGSSWAFNVQHNKQLYVYIKSKKYGPFNHRANFWSCRPKFLGKSDDWYFWYQKNKQYYLNITGKIHGPYKKRGYLSKCFNKNDYYLITKGKKTETIYYKNFKYGPYTAVGSFTLANDNIWGIDHKEGKRHYFIVNGIKFAGPFDKISEFKYNKQLKSWVIIYSKNKKVFVQCGKKTFGPFEKAELSSSYSSNDPYVKCFKDKKHYLLINHKTYGPFSSKFSTHNDEINNKIYIKQKLNNTIVISTLTGRKSVFSIQKMQKKAPAGYRVSNIKLQGIVNGYIGLQVSLSQKGSSGAFYINKKTGYYYKGKIYGPYGPYGSSSSGSGYIWLTATRSNKEYLIINGREYGPFSKSVIYKKKGQHFLVVVEEKSLRMYKIQ